MGAEQFTVKVSGKTAEEAFQKAVADAQYEYGHRGYTGTIAEKSSFKMVTPLSGESPAYTVDRCLDDDNHFCQDKWGPAACVEVGPDPRDSDNYAVSPGEKLTAAQRSGLKVYIFFGWASS